MGYDDDGDNDEHQDEQSENDSYSFRIEKPFSIDRYFGKFDGTLKYLQLASKLKINKNDTTMELKTYKSHYNSYILPNFKLNFTVKDKKDKLSINFKPYCLIPKSHGGLYNVLYPFDGANADLDLSYSTIIFPNSHKVKMQAKIKDKGQMSLKLSRSFSIVQNCLKLYWQSISELTKYKQCRFKSNAEFTYKTLGRRHQINKDYYLKVQEKLGLKLGTEQKPDLKIENSFQILSEQLFSKQAKVTTDDEPQNQAQKYQESNRKIKIKPLHQIKIYSCNKLSCKQKINSLSEYFSNSAIKSSIALSENIYNTNYKVDFFTSNQQLVSWDAKAFIQKNKWRFGTSLSQKNKNKYSQTNSYEKQEGNQAELETENKFNSSNSSNSRKWELFLQKDCLFGLQYFNVGFSYGSNQWGVRAWGKINKKHKYEVVLKQKHNNEVSKSRKSDNNTSYGIKYTYNP